jgi:hypothetical protein
MIKTMSLREMDKLKKGDIIYSRLCCNNLEAITVISQGKECMNVMIRGIGKNHKGVWWKGQKDSIKSPIDAFVLYIRRYL